MSPGGVPQKPQNVSNMFQSDSRLTSISAADTRIPPDACMLNSRRMSTDRETSRQAAEDRYYDALDHYAEGRLHEAIADYEASIATDPTFLDAMHGLARAYQDSEEFDKAISVANRIVELDPDDVLAHTSLSILYQRKGMVPEAEAEAAKARILGWKQQLKQKRTDGM